MVTRLVRAVLVLLPIVACEASTAQWCASDGTSAMGAGDGPAPALETSRLWPNEPAGLTVVSDGPLGTGNAEGWRCEGPGLSVVTDSTAPLSPRSAVVFTYAAGFRSGYAPGVAYYNTPTPIKETYFGFWWKPSDPWLSHASGINKMALLFPITPAAGTIYIMMFFDGTNYTIQVETTFASDTRRLEPNLTATTVVLGRWHRIEWYVRYSTTAMSRDGVVRWWVDGVLQGEYKDLQMPDDAGFTEYTIRPVWGGGEGDAKARTDSFSYGHAHISKAPSGSLQPDTVFADDFESGTLAAWPDGVDPTRQRVMVDPAFARSGTRYLEVTYPAGGDGGWLTRSFMPGYDSLFVSYYVRFPPDWQGGTKLIGLFGARTDDQWSATGKAGICPSGTDFFIAMLITEPGGNPGPTRFYTYYPAMAREPDGVTCWGRSGDGRETYEAPLTLSLGVWHHIEISVKLNAPGQANATQTFWIDGVRRGIWSGLGLRNGDVLRLNAVQLTFNRGVSGGPVAQRMYVDNLVVTTTRPAR